MDQVETYRNYSITEFSLNTQLFINYMIAIRALQHTDQITTVLNGLLGSMQLLGNSAPDVRKRKAILRLLKIAFVQLNLEICILSLLESMHIRYDTIMECFQYLSADNQNAKWKIMSSIWSLNLIIYKPQSKYDDCIIEHHKVLSSSISDLSLSESEMDFCLLKLAYISIFEITTGTNCIHRDLELSIKLISQIKTPQCHPQIPQILNAIQIYKEVYSNPDNSYESVQEAQQILQVPHENLLPQVSQSPYALIKNLLYQIYNITSSSNPKALSQYKITLEQLLKLSTTTINVFTKINIDDKLNGECFHSLIYLKFLELSEIPEGMFDSLSMTLIQCGFPSSILWTCIMSRVINLAVNEQQFSKIAIFIESLKGYVSKEKNCLIQIESMEYGLVSIIYYTLKCMQQYNLKDNLLNLIIALQSVMLNRQEGSIIRKLIKKLNNCKYLLVLKQLLIHIYCLIMKKFNVSIPYDELCEDLAKRETLLYDISSDISMACIQVDYTDIIKK